MTRKGNNLAFQIFCIFACNQVLAVLAVLALEVFFEVFSKVFFEVFFEVFFKVFEVFFKVFEVFFVFVDGFLDIRDSLSYKKTCLR